MLETLILTAAMAATPAVADMSLHTVIPNKWHDSGHAIWQTAPTWMRDFGSCVRNHESHHNYTAQNRISTASGAYQMLAAVWQGNAKWVPAAKQYKKARNAPPAVQDAVFIHSLKHGGADNWNGTHCGHGAS
jgi:hypothetical protein